MQWDIAKTIRVLNLFFICLICFVFSKLFWSFFVGSISSGETYQLSQFRGEEENTLFRSVAEDYSDINYRNIFNSQYDPSKDEQGDVEMKDVLDLLSPPVLSSLPAKLIGTVVRDDVEYSNATVEVNGKSEVFRINDVILGEAKIINIERNRIEFIRNNRREYLAVGVEGARSTDAEMSPTKISGGVMQVDQNMYYVEKGRFMDALSNLASILMDAASVPNIVDGKVEGFIIFAITPGSLFDQLGLKDGDKILAVNGQRITGPEKALTLFQTLKTQVKFTITIERSGTKQKVNYEIK